MKIKVKGINYQSPIPGLAITIMFLGVSIFIFSAFISQIDSFTIESIFSKFLEMGMFLIFAIIFFCFGVYFVYIFFKPPTKYLAVLKQKERINTGSEEYFYVVFETIPNKDSDGFIQQVYEGYIDINSNLLLEQKYLIGIKECNWQIKYVMEYTNEVNYKESIPNAAMGPVILAVTSIFYISSIALIIYGIITCFNTHIFGVVYAIFGIFMFIGILQTHKRLLEIFGKKKD